MPKSQRPDSSSHLTRPPSWAIFASSFIAVFLAHRPLLHLPYYWDEAGYYIPAAYDFFRTGSLVPFSTLSNAHPPIPSIYLAACWKLFGFSPFVTRTAMCAIAAIALTAVWRIALIASRRWSIALATLVLTAIYPVFFAQSSLAHADLFAAAATLWALAFFIDGRRMWPAILCFSIAALSKEIAIVTPLALAGWRGRLALRSHSPQRAGTSVFLMLPALPLGLWYLYHWHRTGFIFGNAAYLRYNATDTLTPLRVLLALWHRTNQITLHMNLFVPVLLALACLLLDPVPDKDGSPRPLLSRENWTLFFVVIITNVIFFSILGGALLTRYLLPLYPLVILLCVYTFQVRVRRWTWFVAFSGIAFLVGLFVNPPYWFAPEDNLSYSDMVRLQQDAISQIIARYPHETVLTAWPTSDELTKPELGYVTHPVSVAAIDNFSFGQIQRAAQSSDYTVGLVFSTKYVPRGALILGRINERMDARFFGFHHDLDPTIIARLLDGQVVWREQRNGQWAAVLHFNRPQVARLDLP